MNGLTITRNKINGFLAVRLHYSAVKSFDNEEWKAKTKKELGLSASAWDQEMEINFMKAGARPMYSDFSYDLHAKDLQLIKHLSLICGIDFGYHHPALVISQINDRDQLVLLEEFMPTDVTIDEFAKQTLLIIKRKYPWHFANREDYIEWFGDPAGNQVSDKSEFTSIEILRNKYNMFIKWKRVGKKQGIRIIQEKLIKRSDRSPGLLIDRQKCPILIEGFLGGYQEDASSGRKASKELPFDDDYYSHTMDALRYIAINKFAPGYRSSYDTSKTELDGYDPFTDDVKEDKHSQSKITGY